MKVSNKLLVGIIVAAIGLIVATWTIQNRTNLKPKAGYGLAKIEFRNKTIYLTTLNDDGSNSVPIGFVRLNIVGPSMSSQLGNEITNSYTTFSNEYKDGQLQITLGLKEKATAQSAMVIPLDFPDPATQTRITIDTNSNRQGQTQVVTTNGDDLDISAGVLTIGGSGGGSDAGTASFTVSTPNIVNGEFDATVTLTSTKIAIARINVTYPTNLVDIVSNTVPAGFREIGKSPFVFGLNPGATAPNSISFNIKLKTKVASGTGQVAVTTADSMVVDIDSNNKTLTGSAANFTINSTTATAAPTAPLSCTQDKTFTDTASSAISCLVKSQICVVGGTSSTLFNPTAKITRAEAVVFLARYRVNVTKDWQYDISGSAFADVPTSHWGYYEITTARKKNMVQGDGTNFMPTQTWQYGICGLPGTSDCKTLSPHGEMTREQFVTALYEYGRQKKQLTSCDSPPVIITDPDPGSGDNGSLKLKVKFQGRSSQNKTVVVKLMQGSQTVRTITNLGTTAVSVAPGTYDLYVKGDIYLQRKVPAVVITASRETSVDISNRELVAGDFDGNNWINIFDFANLGSVWTSMVVPVTDANRKYDVNGDGTITIVDWTIALSSFKTPNDDKGD